MKLGKLDVVSDVCGEIQVCKIAFLLKIPILESYMQLRRKPGSKQLRGLNSPLCDSCSKHGMFQYGTFKQNSCSLWQSLNRRYVDKSQIAKHMCGARLKQ